MGEREQDEHTGDGGTSNDVADSPELGTEESADSLSTTFQEDSPQMRALEAHVAELRSRLLQVLLAFFIATGATFYYSQDLLDWLQADLAIDLNSLAAYEVIYTQLMLAALLGFIIALPVTLYHLLAFVRPGLKPKEYNILRNYLPLFFVLFAIGSGFAYNFIVKASLQFFYQTTANSGVTPVWGLRNTILFVLKISALTGVLFQLPIIASVLAKAGMIDARMMKANRAYFIVGVLLVAALATPPDIITQVMVTVPVIGLYELSIFLVGRMR